MNKLPMNFWSRLESFVSDVQTGCCAGEEEKEMILSVCKSFKANPNTKISWKPEGAFKVGDKVTYFHTNTTAGQKGIIKSLSNNMDIFVVYNCNNDWKNYQDYTGQNTPIENLKHGWL